MDGVRESRKRFAYQAVVTVAGLSLWAFASANIMAQYALREQLTLLALGSLTVVMGMFPISFPMPSSLKLTHQKITFTLSESFIFLVACQYGWIPAVVLGGMEGFIGSRRVIRKLSSNLFSGGMLSLAVAAAAGMLNVVLRYDAGGAGGSRAFHIVAFAFFLTSIVHIIVNIGVLSTLLALRQRAPIVQTWMKNLLWAMPLCLPTSTAASLMYLALQYGALTMLVIGAPILLAIYFGHKQYRDHVRERIALLERATEERIAVTEKAHRQTIEALAVAINAKDEVTHEHVLRVQIYAAGVARLLGCNEEEVEALRAGALLHDIGKIAVPDYILNKPGKLTAAEFDKMKLHTIAGAQILGRVEFPYPVVPVVRSHHERWDGKGYPDGLKGQEIPLTARILSVVDCFDAVREDRQYRKGLTREEAINLIMQGSGAQYDPHVVGTFVTHLPEFEAEIQAHRDVPLPTFGIEPIEGLSEAAREVAPAAGLAEEQRATAAAPTVLTFNLQEQKALATLAQGFAAVRTVEELPAALTHALAALVPFETCAVTLLTPETGLNVVVHAAGLHAMHLEGRQIGTGDGVTGWVLANRRPFCNTDPKLDLTPDVAPHFIDFRTLASVPVIKNKELHGALTLYSTTLKEYDARQQYLLGEPAALFAAALSSNNIGTLDEAAFKLAVPPRQLAPIESELTH